VNREYSLKDPAAADDFMSNAGARYDGVFEQVPGAWSALENGGTTLRLQAVRLSLLQCLSASYAAKDATTFRQASDVFLTHSLAKSAALKPAPGLLAPDLAIAISRGANETAGNVAAKVLTTFDIFGSALENQPLPQTLCAYTLAALLDLDYRRAEASAKRLAAKCDAAAFTEFDNTVFAHWADAAARIARRDEGGLDEDILAIATARVNHIDHEIDKWHNGQPAEVSPIDFWDWNTTALVSLGRNFGTSFDALAEVTSETTPVPDFFDNEWTRASACWASRQR
jgi:hypothetical protein